MTTYTDYRLITRDLTASLKQVAEDTTVERQTEYYKENISKVKSVEEFLADDQLFSYAMKAHGLEEMTYAKGLIRKVLEQGTSDDDALANKFTDERYKEFADAFDFFNHGENATIFTSAQQGTIDKYMRQTLEEQAGETNEGVRLALYFERKLPEILEENETEKSRAFAIMGDNALGTVLRTALGISENVVYADVDLQAEMIVNRLNFEDLKDEEKLAGFMEDFTAMWEVNNSTVGITSAADLIGTNARGISADLMMSLNTLKLGGR